VCMSAARACSFALEPGRCCGSFLYQEMITALLPQQNAKP